MAMGLDSFAGVAVGDEALGVLSHGGLAVLAREAFEGLVIAWVACNRGIVAGSVQTQAELGPGSSGIYRRPRCRKRLPGNRPGTVSVLPATIPESLKDLFSERIYYVGSCLEGSRGGNAPRGGGLSANKRMPFSSRDVGRALTSPVSSIGSALANSTSAIASRSRIRPVFLCVLRESVD